MSIQRADGSPFQNADTGIGNDQSNCCPAKPTDPSTNEYSEVLGDDGDLCESKGSIVEQNTNPQALQMDFSFPFVIRLAWEILPLVLPRSEVG